MAQEIINIGTTPNDGTGDPLRTAFNKVNENFTELYADDAGDVNSIEATAPIARDNATGAVTISLSDLGVTSGKLAADSVITDKILDLNVTTAKIADDAVTTDKLANSINTTITDLQTDKYDKTGGTISGNAAITGNLIVDTNTLYVDSTNNRVGIGTDSPASILHTQGAGGATSSPIIETTDTSAYVGLKIKQNGDFWVSKDNSTGSSFNTAPYANVLWGNGSYPMVFSTNSVERMRITSGGDISFRDTSANEALYWDASTARLGIGTTSPTSKLSIDAGAQQDAISINSSDGDGPYAVWRRQNVTIGFVGNANALSLSGNTNFGVRATNDLVFAAGGGTERMRITNAGNVGIGTTSPSQLFEVVGGTQIKSNGTVYLGYTDGTASGGYKLEVNGKLHIGGDSYFAGNVGIGTTSPSAPLTVKTNSSGVSIRALGRSADGYSFLTFRNSTDSATLGEIGISNAQNMQFYTAGAERMRITSAGNVGIGTTSPSNGVSGLHIAVASSTDQLYLERTGSGTGKFYLGAAANSFLIVDAAQSAERMRIDSSGNVGIGTDSPATTLEVSTVGTGNGNGQVLAETQGANGNAGYGFRTNGTTRWTIVTIGTDGANDLRFYNVDNSAERMRITSGGNVGIDVSSPQERLDVGGVMRAFGYESRSGTNGITQYTGSFFNIFWTGSSAQLYIDTASVGTITLTSDYRVKKNIETQNASAIERINALRPVKYEYADYENIFVADNIQREGFIAHEVAQIIPSAVEGEKDAENAFQSLKLDAMLSVAVKAIQEQQEIINDLKTRIETLENQ